MNTAPVYVMGHADLEIERLQLQASIIAGVTRRLIQECGIRPGMRVLDLGCGVGDVSMLLAEAVGDAGSVVAIDREPRAIEIARARATAAGYRQIEWGIDRRRPRLADLAMACNELSRVAAAHCSPGRGARRRRRSRDHRRPVECTGSGPPCTDCFQAAVLRLGRSPLRIGEEISASIRHCEAPLETLEEESKHGEHQRSERFREHISRVSLVVVWFQHA